MGQGLPKAVTSVVVERSSGSLFRVGVAEMNGWRISMEDMHVIFMQDTWGLFGVLDGHGGDQCSSFIAQRMEEELARGAPEDDEAMTALALRLDREFLELQQPSGSTGTFVLVRPVPGSEKYSLRVANLGDSRILLGRADGSMVEGPGTDGGLTTDHKPDQPGERARIERTGGTVQEVMGVARVNGDLAMSRAFGDAQHKQTGGPAQEDHPVSAAPELLTLECQATDFLVLVCDGISEGEFPNREVVRLAAKELKSVEGPVDPGAVAAAVCREALRCGSKDNLSCMIVLLGGGEVAKPGRVLEPGPFDAPDHPGFRKAYVAMAARVGLSLAQAVEMRYDAARKDRVEGFVRQSNGTQEGDGGEGCGVQSPALRLEIARFGDGPPSDLAVGSAERTQWFSKWLEEHGGDKDTDGTDAMPVTQDQLLEIFEDDPHLMAMAQAQGLVSSDLSNARARRLVRVAPVGQLRLAVEANRAIQWDARLAELCGKRGTVTQDDNSDGTSRVRFAPSVGVVAWLPTCALIDEEESASGGNGASGDAAEEVDEDDDDDDDEEGEEEHEDGEEGQEEQEEEQVSEKGSGEQECSKEVEEAEAVEGQKSPKRQRMN